ncbi:heme-degrading domain-containing protein [Levilactobacillus hammesii]|uniref:Uncharacterized protein n=1 Tax=Levilactobacillus hammesii DSM 16381 TaxID=1423753 RepID=A0A0R1UXB6_9LACO|nr:heme-degrading domain-containing protein [Levilactobacillus hammesii]KRL95461.1 hypothetical protein FD28_GL002427 [Levilactobacillus hammesii DSM 16381]
MKMPVMAEVQADEAALQFSQFSNTTALQLGAQLVARAQAQNAAVTIDITRNRQQLFHAAMPGTAIDNDKWLQRKINTVYEYGTSSLRKQLEMTARGQTLEEAAALDGHDYAAAGGGFPVVLRGTGLIGSIAVSGLASGEDHQLIVETLREFLK